MVTVQNIKRNVLTQAVPHDVCGCIENSKVTYSKT